MFQLPIDREREEWKRERDALLISYVLTFIAGCILGSLIASMFVSVWKG